MGLKLDHHYSTILSIPEVGEKQKKRKETDWGRQCETPTLTLNLYVDFETFSLDFDFVLPLKQTYYKENQSEIPANGDS